MTTRDNAISHKTTTKTLSRKSLFAFMSPDLFCDYHSLNDNPNFALTREALCKSCPQFQIALLASATCHYKCIIAHMVTTTIA
jgi:hypothetical protein